MGRRPPVRDIPGGGIDAHRSSTVRRRGQGSETTPLGTQAAFFVTGFGPETEESDDCGTIAGATIAILPRPMRAGDRFAGRREGAAADKSMRQAIESGQVGFQALGELLPPLVRTAGLLVLACFRALPPNRPFRRRPPGPMYRGPRSNILCEREGPALPHAQRDQHLFRAGRARDLAAASCR